MPTAVVVAPVGAPERTGVVSCALLWAVVVVVVSSGCPVGEVTSGEMLDGSRVEVRVEEAILKKPDVENSVLAVPPVTLGLVVVVVVSSIKLLPVLVVVTRMVVFPMLRNISATIFAVVGLVVFEIFLALKVGCHEAARALLASSPRDCRSDKSTNGL